MLKKVRELLKPGGRILLTTPAVDNPIGLFIPSYSDAPYSAPCHVSLFTTKALKRLLSRLNFDIERIEASESWGVLEKLFASLFYKLDFLSPCHDNDDMDFLYTPNMLGKLCGLKSQRHLSAPIWRMLRRVDNQLAAICRRYPRLLPMNGHMYLLAIKRS